MYLVLLLGTCLDQLYCAFCKGYANKAGIAAFGFFELHHLAHQIVFWKAAKNTDWSWAPETMVPLMIKWGTEEMPLSWASN